MKLHFLLSHSIDIHQFATTHFKCRHFHCICVDTAHTHRRTCVVKWADCWKLFLLLHHLISVTHSLCFLFTTFQRLRWPSIEWQKYKKYWWWEQQQFMVEIAQNNWGNILLTNTHLILFLFNQGQFFQPKMRAKVSKRKVRHYCSFLLITIAAQH